MYVCMCPPVRTPNTHTRMLQWLLSLTMTLGFALGNGALDRLVYSYGDYGPYHGEYSVSPAGARGPLASSGLPGTWFRTLTGPEGGATVLLTAFRDAAFPRQAISGSLKNHITILSKILSVLLLQDGSKEELRALKGRLDGLLADHRRPLLFRKAFSPARIQAILGLLGKLDVTKWPAAGNAYVEHMLGVTLRSLEEALLERTILLMATRLYPQARDGFLSGLLQFHYGLFVAQNGNREIRVSMTPDVALLIAHLELLVCRRAIKADIRAFVEYNEKRLIHGAHRSDL